MTSQPNLLQFTRLDYEGAVKNAVANHEERLAELKTEVDAAEKQLKRLSDAYSDLGAKHAQQHTDSLAKIKAA